MHRVKKNALFLIDGSSFLYRAYYALKPLHTSKGVPVQATYGFCRMIHKLIKDFSPTSMALVWDTRGKTFRHEMYEEYKATRQEPPSDLGLQKEHIQKVADLIGLCQVAKEGYEADDLIASLATDYEKEQVIIISPDKDLQQLITKNILVFDPFKREIIDREVFENKNEFGPERLLLYHALVGDTSDNIPGVRGVGDKSARELAKNYSSLDELYAHIDEVEKTRVRNALVDHKDKAYLSAELFELKYIKVGVSAGDLAFEEEKLQNAIPFFQELEFKSLLRELGGESVAPAKEKVQPAGEIKQNWETVIVRDEATLRQLASDARKAGFFAYDTETTGLDAMKDSFVGLSIALDTKKSYYVPVNHDEDGQLPIEVVREVLGPLFADEKVGKTVHQGKFDAMVLHGVGITVRGVVFDSILAANLLRKAWQKVGLKALSQTLLDEPMHSFAQVLGTKRKTFAEVSIDEGAAYSAHDALQTFKLKPVLEKELASEPKIKEHFYTIELPMSSILLQMEIAGILLKPAVLEEVGGEIEKELRKIERKILKAIDGKREDEGFNLNSPQQVEALLFDELKLPAMKKSAQGRRSTDADVLGELAKIHPVPGMIITYRELFKLKSTYIDALPERIYEKTGRLHTVYGQTDIVTGRISSSGPNLQNIPASAPYGMAIRSAFVAGRGRRFVAADYSQIDLRVLAHLSKDEGLVNAYKQDEDVHRKTAAQIFDVPLEKVTGEQRQVGKRINFSIIYGLTPFGLSRDLGIKPSEAKEYIEKYFEQFPQVAKWMEQVVEQAKRDGYVETLLGRRRYVPGLQERNRALYERAKRFTMNYPIQGTSAEVMKLAMIEIDKVFRAKKLDAQMILQIHDELIVECDMDIAADVEQILIKEMEGAVSWDIPMRVATRVGTNWRDVTK